jgi:hypothetical protein
MSVPSSGRSSPPNPLEFSLGMKKSKATTPRPGTGSTLKNRLDPPTGAGGRHGGDDHRHDEQHAEGVGGV